MKETYLWAKGDEIFTLSCVRICALKIDYENAMQQIRCPNKRFFLIFIFNVTILLWEFFYFYYVETIVLIIPDNGAKIWSLVASNQR